jgi:hypothetical protein
MKGVLLWGPAGTDACDYVGESFEPSDPQRQEHFSQYQELSNGCYEQLSFAESCVNFCGFGLHLCENAQGADTLGPVLRSMVR